MKKHVLAALCILAVLLPMAAMAGTGEIQLGADGIEAGNKVYFGNYETGAVPWLMLEVNPAYDEGDPLLLSEYLLGKSEFRDDDGYYIDSALKTKMDGLYTSLFASSERGAILEKENLNCDGSAGADPGSPVVLSAHLYPLSYAEVETQISWADPTNHRIAKYIDDPDGDAGAWWLRSSENETTSCGVMGAGDEAGVVIFKKNEESMGVRPAFNLDKSKVLMISDVDGGKPLDVDSALNTKINTDATPTKWKLTLHDESRDFKLTSASVSGNMLTIEYAGATTGTNEYISAIVEDERGNIVEYGNMRKLPAGSDPNGSVTIYTPKGVMDGERTLYVFSEQYNDDKKTDYASSLCRVAIATTSTQLNFGRAFENETPPAAQTATIQNICKQPVTVSLPTLEDYTVSINKDVDSGEVKLEPGEEATLTIRPKEGLGVGAHKDTLTVRCKDDPSSASVVIPVKFLVSGSVDAIQLGTSAIENPDGDATPSVYSHVYFGTDGGEPIEWRVLDRDNTNMGSKGMFLLSEAFIGNDRPRFHHTYVISYQRSDLHTFLQINDDGGLPNPFSASEQNCILPASKGEGLTGNNDSLSGDILFPLSWDEATSRKYFPNDDVDRRKGDSWWLRTASGSNNVRFIQTGGYTATSEEMGAAARLRLAFNLDASKILFASAAEDGKEAKGMAEGLTAIGKKNTDRWKLTLLDDGEERKGFAVSTGEVSGAAGGVVRVEYTGAKDGTDEYLSAMIVNDKKKVLYYGRLKNIASPGDASGTLNITLPAKLAVGAYTLKLFSEQYNDGQKPDYASAFADVTLTVSPAPAITYYTISAAPNNAAYGSVTGGGTYASAVLVTLTAAANEGHHFVKWTEDGADVDTANPLTFYAAADRTLTAVFGASANPPASENAITGITAGRKYSVGDEVTFTAVGSGMDNDSPDPNDTRWLPTAWETNPSGNFDTGSTQSFSTAEMRAGDHTLRVEFTKQRYTGEVWENAVPAETDVKSVDFILLAAPRAFGLETLALKIGHSFDLKRLTGESEGSWRISEPIAKISAKNILTPQKRGSAELVFTLADGGHKRVALYVVKPEEEISKVVPNSKTYILAPGDALAPEASVKPKRAPYARLLWTPENPDLLKNTGKGEFEALAVGKTSLIATAASGKTAEIRVIVTDVPHSISLDRKKAALKKGDKLTLTLDTYLPASLPTPPLTWTSSDKKVASVDENGVVTALTKGKATITAKADGGAKAKVKITVK